MKSALANLLVIGFMVSMGGALLWQKSKAPPHATPSPEKKKAGYDICYREEAARKLSGVATDATGLEQAWHRQFVALMASERQKVGVLPADMVDLPDFPAPKLQSLRMTAAYQRAAGQTALYEAMRKFRGARVDDIIRPDNRVRDEVRNILFLWAKTEGVPPDSRGPFIDARELAFTESYFGNAYFQIGRYPNPSTVSAQLVRETFNVIVDEVYARLVWYGVGREMFKKVKRAGGKSEVVIDSVTLDYIAHRATTMTPKEREIYWRNTVLALPDYGNYTVSKANMERLEKAIAASPIGLTLPDILESLKRRRVKMWWDEKGRAMRLHMTYSQNMNVRQICYSWVKDGVPDAVVRNLP